MSNGTTFSILITGVLKGSNMQMGREQAVSKQVQKMILHEYIKQRLDTPLFHKPYYLPFIRHVQVEDFKQLIDIELPGYYNLNARNVCIIPLITNRKSAIIVIQLSNGDDMLLKTSLELQRCISAIADAERNNAENKI